LCVQQILDELVLSDTQPDIAVSGARSILHPPEVLVKVRRKGRVRDELPASV
jgi:hypothetical protein